MTWLISYGISGIRQISDPPAIAVFSAIQPASRPITSRIRTRLWLAAVVTSLSTASVAIWTAVWKPKVISVAERSLSIVLGTPTIGSPFS